MTVSENVRHFRGLKKQNSKVERQKLEQGKHYSGYDHVGVRMNKIKRGVALSKATGFGPKDKPRV